MKTSPMRIVRMGPYVSIEAVGASGNRTDDGRCWPLSGGAGSTPETDYRKWFDDISRVASHFTGYLGATLEGPTSTNEFHLIFRYNNIEHLRDWERSQEREEWTAKLDGIVEGATRVDEYCGLEFLFDSNGPDIPKYRIVIVLTVVVFAMLLILRPIVAAILTSIPAALQLFLVVAIQVIVMTYAVMPLIYRYLGGWLRK